MNYKSIENMTMMEKEDDLQLLIFFIFTIVPMLGFVLYFTINY